MSALTTVSRKTRGAVLLVVVSLLGLLTVLVLSLNALLRLDVQVESNRAAQARARAQALAALEIAVGQLQRYAGPDARATAAAGDDTANPGWVGVWASDAGAGTPLVWLVSGNEDDPLRVDPSSAVESPDVAGAETIWLLNRSVPAEDAAWRVKLRPVDVLAHHPGQTARVPVSRFAYWIGDENQKLSIAEPPMAGALPSDYPRPRLDVVFDETVPVVERRARVIFVDQAIEAGFDRGTVRERWLELTAQAWRVGEGPGGAELIPMGFNVNSTAGSDIWQAVLSPAEPVLPAEVRDSPDALEALYRQVANAIEAAPRPLRNIEEFHAVVATAFTPESDLTAYWAHLDPVLSVRGDTFLVRAYGEVSNPSLDAAAPPEGRAWLEAVVQRIPDPHPDAPFGRVFRVVSLRWLSAEDV